MAEPKVRESKQEQSLESSQIETLKAQIELMQSKMSKPKTAQEEFEAREALYEARKSEREALQAQIDARRLEILSDPAFAGKCRMDDAIILEAWERRSKALEKTNSNHSIMLMNEFKRKSRDIKNSL